MNCAASIDGKIASVQRKQMRISSDEDMERVKRLRLGSDAILVGVGTVIADNPGLKAPAGGAKPLLRVIVDSKGRTPPGSHVLDGSAPTLIAMAQGPPASFPNAEVFRAGKGRVDLGALLAHLEGKGIRKLLVEGGGEVIQSFIAQGLVDDLYLFVGDLVIGGRDAPTVADGDGHPDLDAAPRARFVSAERLGAGLLLHYRFGAAK